MLRTPEPELMDDPAQAQAYAQADFSAPHQFFVEQFGRRFPGRRVTGRVVDLGCGDADVTVRFARANPYCRVLAVDAAPAMLDQARRRLAREALASRIALLEGLLPQCLEGLPRFETVISNSLLHHLAEPATLWRAVRRAVRPGAAVFIMDLMRPESPAAALALRDTYAAGEPEVLRRDFLNSLHAAYRVDEVRRQLDDAGLEQLAVEAVSDRHWVVWGELDAA